MSEETEALEPLDIDESDDTAPAWQDWQALTLIALGGAVGTTLRYLISNAIPAVDGLRTGIFVVNVSGAFLIGVLIESLALRGDDTGRRRHLRLLLGTGVLGGYTTYSALALDAASLLDVNRVLVSIGYGVATVVAGGLATWLGIRLARRVDSALARRIGGAR